MSIYPDTIKRCQHIKVNGIQCGSPALRNQKFCYFHNQWRQTTIALNSRSYVRGNIDFPVLEDANSIQICLMQIMRLIVYGQIDNKTAGLLLYGLQTASNNLRRTTFEPYPPKVIIDPDWTEDTCLGENAWQKEDFEVNEEEEENEHAEEGEDQDDEEENAEGENNAGQELDSVPEEPVDPNAITDEQLEEIIRNADLS